MAGANENRRAVKPSNFRETTNRRALKDLNNYVGAPQQYPCAVNKRQMLEKDVAYVKTFNLLPQRPMTRKFAAALANKSQPSNEETSEGHVHINQNKKHSKPVTTDLDFLPMVVDSEETDCELTEEIDMEDLEIESALDIDMYDVGNPLYVVDYVDDIYTFYKRVERTSCVNPDYMFCQFDINDKMRAILIDWLIEVHYKFELMEETLYLTINIIDRFLSMHSIIRKKLQLVGVTAMLLACKYEEVSVPVIDDLILIADRAYTRDDVLDMEKLIVKTLKFNMSVPTPYVFMRRFLKTAESDKKLELLSFFIIELSLVEYGMLKFQPSLLAAAAVYTAQCCLKGFRCWSKTSELYTTYTVNQLLECSKMMVNFHQNAGSGKLTGVHRKYSTVKFGYAAKSDPALFLLDIIP